MKGFGDFNRIAVVVIPDDEEFKQRIQNKSDIEGKVETDSVAVNELKGKESRKKIKINQSKIKSEYNL